MKKKRKYQKPVLKHAGTVKKLTLTNGSAGGDANNQKMGMGM